MDEVQLSRSMSAYVETFAEPDEETTSRMRERVRDHVLARQQRRRARRRALVLTACVTVIGLGVGAYGLGRRDGQAPAAVASGGEAGQRLDIPGQGSLELRPSAQVRFFGELLSGGEIEVLFGEVGVHQGPDTRPLQLRSGGYALSCEACELELRHTGSLPVVRVERGRARLTGPDLPAEGVWLSAPGSEKK